MTLKLTSLILLALCTAQAAVAQQAKFKEDVGDIADRFPGAKAAVIFKSANPLAASAKIEREMVASRGADESGRRGWITRVLASYVDMSTGCGVVVGQWAARDFKQASEFKQAMLSQAKDASSITSFVYLTADGGVAKPDKSNIDTSDAWFSACIDGEPLEEPADR